LYSLKVINIWAKFFLIDELEGVYKMSLLALFVEVGVIVVCNFVE
jgi:hypothetical protein